MIETISSSEIETREIGARLATVLCVGDVVLLEGQLGVGKTTLVRGLVEALGHVGPTRSPTYNLIQIFDTEPPILHADLYRLESARGIGLEDYLATHVCIIEWPDRSPGFVNEHDAWLVRIEFAPDGRKITVREPSTHSAPFVQN